MKEIIYYLYITQLSFKGIFYFRLSTQKWNIHALKPKIGFQKFQHKVQ